MSETLAGSRRRVAIVGAGAAGTMAAIFAAAAGAETVLLEGTKDGGRKILISGGGRCNVLPMRVDESRFVTDSSVNTLRRMVRTWPLAEQRRFFEQDAGIPLVDEPEDAKVFPASNRARDVRDGLLALAARKGAELLMDTRVQSVTPDGAQWRIERSNGAPLVCDAVILACGGLSVPNTGSDGTGLTIARALGHTMHVPYAALTPLLDDTAAFTSLSGISLSATLTARAGDRQATATGGFLFTHRGYSGPSVLDVSHVLVRARAEHGDAATSRAPARDTRAADSRAADNRAADNRAADNRAADNRAALHVKWTALGDAQWEQALKPNGARTVTGALRAEMPDRLASALLAVADVDSTRVLAELRRDERLRLIETLVRCPLPWTGDEGYKKAEVTGGGVSLADVDSRTMQSRRHPGLYLCGEMLDAFGPIGGYNFLWAWATGRAAGIGAAAG